MVFYKTRKEKANFDFQMTKTFVRTATTPDLKHPKRSTPNHSLSLFPTPSFELATSGLSILLLHFLQKSFNFIILIANRFLIELKSKNKFKENKKSPCARHMATVLFKPPIN